MLAIGSDHAGYELKCEVKKFLDGLGVEYIDCGCNGELSLIHISEPTRESGLPRHRRKDL